MFRIRAVVVALLLVLMPLQALSAPKVGAPLRVIGPSLMAAAATSGPHQTNLNWVLSTDDNATNCTTITSCSQNVYRAAGACTSTTTFGTPLFSASSSAVNYSDTAVVVGLSYCYAVTFVVNGTESVKSNTVSVTIAPYPPTGVTGTPQ